MEIIANQYMECIYTTKHSHINTCCKKINNDDNLSLDVHSIQDNMSSFNEIYNGILNRIAFPVFGRLKCHYAMYKRVTLETTLKS